MTVEFESNAALGNLSQKMFGLKSLSSTGSLATLLVVVGILDINDAANSVHLTPNDLINEALAWEAAAAYNDSH